VVQRQYEGGTGVVWGSTGAGQGWDGGGMGARRGGMGWDGGGRGIADLGWFGVGFFITPHQV
jgi:hypothetical protein